MWGSKTFLYTFRISVFLFLCAFLVAIITRNIMFVFVSATLLLPIFTYFTFQALANPWRNPIKILPNGIQLKAYIGPLKQKLILDNFEHTKLYWNINRIKRNSKFFSGGELSSVSSEFVEGNDVEEIEYSILFLTFETKNGEYFLAYSFPGEKFSAMLEKLNETGLSKDHIDVILEGPGSKIRQRKT